MSSENTGTTPGPAAGDEERIASLENQIRELGDRLASLADRGATPISNPPIGTVVAYAGEVDQGFEELQGWLVCDGRPLSAAETYQNLSLAIGTTYGDGRDEAGNRVGDFNLPDYRGYFLRGVDAGAGVDRDASSRRSPSALEVVLGDSVGSLQGDALKGHDHKASGTLDARSPFTNVPRAIAEWKSGFAGGGAFDDGGTMGVARNQRSVTVKVEQTTGAETRPVNMSVNWIIKYRPS